MTKQATQRLYVESQNYEAFRQQIQEMDNVWIAQKSPLPATMITPGEKAKMTINGQNCTLTNAIIQGARLTQQRGEERAWALKSDSGDILGVAIQVEEELQTDLEHGKSIPRAEWLVFSKYNDAKLIGQKSILEKISKEDALHLVNVR